MYRLITIGLRLSLMLLLGFPFTTLAGEVKIEHTVFIGANGETIRSTSLALRTSR